MDTLKVAHRQRAVGIVSDGKPGHLNQSFGLADALQRLVPGIEVREIAAMSAGKAIAEFIAPQRPEQALDLLVAAGHGTHLSLLALRRAYRCPAIVLMRPSFPGAFFDVRIEPRHDGGRDTPRCWISEGPLNRMQPADTRSEEGLILIGGPSPHFHWDDRTIVEQVTALCDGRRPWQLSGSRRTPSSLMEALWDLNLPELTVHEASALPGGWLAENLPRAAECWVSPDSASMVYEALTAGCAVGVFKLAPANNSRVVSAIDGLLAQQKLTAFDAFQAGAVPAAPAAPFAEADRMAKRILEQGWL